VEFLTSTDEGTFFELVSLTINQVNLHRIVQS